MKAASVSALAKQDLKEIQDFVAQDKPQAAAKLIESLLAKFQLLAAFPELGSRCDEFGVGFRRLSWRNYLIFYAVIEYGEDDVGFFPGDRILDVFGEASLQL